MNKLIFLGIPKEWKNPKIRVKCKFCKTGLWVSGGNMPKDHDRPDGKICRKVLTNGY